MLDETGDAGQHPGDAEADDHAHYDADMGKEFMWRDGIHRV
jgi:hypothetical protein